MEHTFNKEKENLSNMRLHISNTSNQENELEIEEIHSKLEKIYLGLQGKLELALGYPVNQKFDYSAISPFFNLHLNHAGDSYVNNGKLLNIREIESNVLEYFSKLWNADSRNPLTPHSYWGYVLGMRSTEGNMYALWSAREYFKEKTHSEKHGSALIEEPILFYSQESHYSIEKSSKILSIPSFYDVGIALYPGQCPTTADGHWPQWVPVDQYGAVDPESLSNLVNFFAKKGHPPIIVLNEGTTFQGAFDNAQAVWERLYPVLEAHGFCLKMDGDNRPDFWIHIDGAIGAAYLTYLEIAYEEGLTSVVSG